MLHIGTHKTASTSIQHFLALNRSVLKSQGFLYPKNQDSAYVFNFLASKLAHGKHSEVDSFFLDAKKQAEESSCHTLVISAESFYAMTGFFIDIQKRERQEDYWENEKKLIAALKSACQIFSNIKIACYFRPQDELSSSLYNQLVKNTFGITTSYEELVTDHKEIYDYLGHIRLWDEAFKRDSISLKNFHDVKDDIIKDFCQSFLNEKCYADANLKIFESNTRLNRDVLEVKRLYNATKPDPALAYISARSFRKINDHFPDQKGYQIFSSQKAREGFFCSFHKGNETLSKEYGLSVLQTFSDSGEPTYPGLTPEMTAEVYFKFCEDLYKPLNRLELAGRRMARWIMDKAPGGKNLLAPLKNLHNSLRLRIAGW